MSLKLSTETVRLHTRHPFVIARGSSSECRRIWVRLSDADGVEGWGEADPSSYYGETADTVLAALRELGPDMPDDPFQLEEAERRFVGKRLGQPLWRLWGLDPARAPRSSFTIGLDTVEGIRTKVAEAVQYPILKVKLGTDRDEEFPRTIRNATEKPIRVDANAAWTRERAMRML